MSQNVARPLQLYRSHSSTRREKVWKGHSQIKHFLISTADALSSDDDEEDLENDDDEEVPAHDPDSEPLPDLPIYHPSVKVVETLCSELVSEFQFFIDSSEYRDDETDYLLEESKVLEHPPHESHVLRIALIGDAGQGKSSLLNSMLGQENLAIHVGLRFRL